MRGKRGDRLIIDDPWAQSPPTPTEHAAAVQAFLASMPRKSWYIQALPDGGVMIAPVYRGNFGCRLWHVETIGL